MWHIYQFNAVGKIISTILIHHSHALELKSYFECSFRGISFHLVWLLKKESVCNSDTMFGIMHFEYRETAEENDYGEITKTVLLALLMVFLSFIVLIFLVGLGYAILIYAVKLFQMMCCASCKRNSQKDSLPPSYDSLCNYYKSNFFFLFLSLIILLYYFVLHLFNLWIACHFLISLVVIILNENTLDKEPHWKWKLNGWDCIQRLFNWNLKNKKKNMLKYDWSRWTLTMAHPF